MTPGWRLRWRGAGADQKPLRFRLSSWNWWTCADVSIYSVFQVVLPELQYDPWDEEDYPT